MRIGLAIMLLWCLKDLLRPYCILRLLQTVKCMSSVLRACLYDVPVYRDLGLLIICCYFCSCVYMETGTSRLNGILVKATEIPVKRDKLCPYKRNIPVHRDEVKWTLKRRLTRENLQKRKQKETTFVGMLFMQTKLVFVLLTNYYELFHAFFNEVNTSRSLGTSRCTEII